MATDTARTYPASSFMKLFHLLRLSINAGLDSAYGDSPAVRTADGAGGTAAALPRTRPGGAATTALTHKTDVRKSAAPCGPRPRRVCCVRGDGGSVGSGGSAGHIASASSVNAVARRSCGEASVASS